MKSKHYNENENEKLLINIVKPCFVLIQNPMEFETKHETSLHAKTFKFFKNILFD